MMISAEQTRVFCGSCVALLLALLHVGAAYGGEERGVVLVKNGKPQATIYHDRECGEAAKTLAKFLKQMSGAELPLREVAGKDEARGSPGAVVLGALAVKLGAEIPPASVSREGFHLKAGAGKVLLAGESPAAVEFGVFEILERLGCGYYFDHQLGLVVPEKKTVVLDPVDTSQTPSFETRRISGSAWSAYTLWKRWNRAGGRAATTRHAWAGLVPANKYAAAHPEYYPLRSGKRNPRRQLCSSNPDVIRIATRTVLERFAAGIESQSLSPDDGGGFCECARCKALDVPGYFEPSSGRINVTDRYMRFWNAIGNAAHEKYPGRRLHFYAYSDYTLPPKRVREAAPNLMMWIAPIRHSRVHAMSGTKQSWRREALKKAILDWSKVVQQYGYRTYNFNLAECLVPFSKVTIWKNDIPWLHANDCTGLNLETIHSIAIMAPTIWISTRLAWDVRADADALMTRFWNDLFGPRAGPVMKRYWDRLDAAWVNSPTGSGSFFSVPPVFTETLLRDCRADLEQAKKMLSDKTRQERWALFEHGFRNAEMYMAMHRALNAGKYVQAARIYEDLEDHVEEQVQRKWANAYTLRYLRRFAARAPREAGDRASGGNEVVATLPDVWRFRRDEKNEGEAQGFFGPKEIGQWRDVRTFSATLDRQGIPDKMTYLWYRSAFTAPAAFRGRALWLWFGGVDKQLKVWINGVPVEATVMNRKTGKRERTVLAPGGHSRPVEFEITNAVTYGKPNRVAVWVDHTSLSELALGGIVKLVFVYAAAPGRPLVSFQPEAGTGMQLSPGKKK